MEQNKLIFPCLTAEEINDATEAYGRALTEFRDYDDDFIQSIYDSLDELPAYKARILSISGSETAIGSILHLGMIIERLRNRKEQAGAQINQYKAYRGLDK